jgi:hypothetical protein
MFVVGVVLAVGASAPAQAGSVLFTNLGAGDSYNGSDGWTLGSPDPNDYLTVGSAFTAGATAALGTIEVAAGIVRGTNLLTISLDADSGGAPGAVIESFTLNNAMPAFGTVSSGSLVTATSVLHPLLTAGTQYWVVLNTPNDGTTWAAWNLNTIGDSGPFFQTDNGSPPFPGPNTRGAMRITGQAVPEPSSMALAGTALLMIGCCLRRRIRTTAA